MGRMLRWGKRQESYRPIWGTPRDGNLYHKEDIQNDCKLFRYKYLDGSAHKET